MERRSQVQERERERRSFFCGAAGSFTAPRFRSSFEKFYIVNFIAKHNTINHHTINVQSNFVLKPSTFFTEGITCYFINAYYV